MSEFHYRYDVDMILTRCRVRDILSIFLQTSLVFQVEQSITVWVCQCVKTITFELNLL